GTAISITPLTGTSLSCALVTACESSKAWAAHLPWLTEAELYAAGTEEGFADLILPHTGGGNPGWYGECTILGIKISEECTAPELISKQVNVATGVDGTFSEAFTLLLEGKLALCTGNNEETGVIRGTGGITVNSLSGPLSLSSEGETELSSEVEKEEPEFDIAIIRNTLPREVTIVRGLIGGPGTGIITNEGSCLVGNKIAALGACTFDQRAPTGATIRVR
ncbi:MAG: hypothetical protein WAU42_08360, partial [Solirubrobacteraceae bacterium]